MAVTDRIELGIDEIFSTILDYVVNYSGFVAGIVVGLAVGFLYHKFTGYGSLKRSFNERLKDKDAQIDSLKAIVHEELSKITVAKQSEAFFKRLKRYYKQGKIQLKLSKA